MELKKVKVVKLGAWPLSGGSYSYAIKQSLRALELGVVKRRFSSVIVRKNITNAVGTNVAIAFDYDSVRTEAITKSAIKQLGLSIGKKKTGGRNNQGRITSFHRGGGNKIRYIYLNKTSENKSSQQVHGACNGKVKYIVKDSNRTAWIAGIYWSNPYAVDLNLTQRVSLRASKTKKDHLGINPWYSYYSNILAPEGLKIGSYIRNSSNITGIPQGTNKSAYAGLEGQGVIGSKIIGQQAYLKDLMVGTLVHNIQGKYIRAAGCAGIIVSKTENTSKIDLTGEGKALIGVAVKFQSGQSKIFSGETVASLGVLSNGEHKTRDYRKAGQKRWLGRRPIVRGVAMNPVDHPHGGGEGKTSGGRPSVTPWGKPTKGKPTRSSRRS